MDASLIWMGVLPIVAFLVLDSLTGQKKALLGALVLAVAEVVYSLVKFGTIDYLTWLTFFVLAIFVGLSIWKENDIYFKIQGPVINTFTALIIWGAYLFFGRNLMLDMTVKYIGLDKMASMNPVFTVEFLTIYLSKINFHLPIWLLLHGLLTLWAAFKWNKWVWAIIRVLGFYGIAFVGMVIIMKSGI